MSFRFRKIYADIAAPDGTVWITYLAWLEAWGIRSAFGGVEMYRPDGTREVRRALPPPSSPIPLGDGRPVELSLDFGTYALSLHYEPFHSAWRPEGSAPGPYDWSVLVPAGMATARCHGDAGIPGLAGTGYVDWVEITRIPRRLGLRTLEWGRVHLPERTLVYTATRSASGEWWRQIAYWPTLAHEAPRVGRDFRVVPVGEERIIEIPGDDGAGMPNLVLQPRRALHRGGVVDDGRSPARLERLALRLLVGPSDETRWVSSAHPVAPSGAPPGIAVHEAVRFGSS